MTLVTIYSPIVVASGFTQAAFMDALATGMGIAGFTLVDSFVATDPVRIFSYQYNGQVKGTVYLRYQMNSSFSFPTNCQIGDGYNAGTKLLLNPNSLAALGNQSNAISWVITPFAAGSEYRGCTIRRSDQTSILYIAGAKRPAFIPHDWDQNTNLFAFAFNDAFGAVLMPCSSFPLANSSTGLWSGYHRAIFNAMGISNKRDFTPGILWYGGSPTLTQGGAYVARSSNDAGLIYSLGLVPGDIYRVSEAEEYTMLFNQFGNTIASNQAQALVLRSK